MLLFVQEHERAAYHVQLLSAFDACETNNNDYHRN